MANYVCMQEKKFERQELDIKLTISFKPVNSIYGALGSQICNISGNISRSLSESVSRFDPKPLVSNF